MQKILKESDGILVRKPYAKEILKNSECDVILFNDSLLISACDSNSFNISINLLRDSI